VLATLRAELAALRAQLQLQPAVTFLAAGIGLCLYHFHPADRTIAGWLAPLGLGDEALRMCMGWNLSAIYCLVLFPLAARFAAARIAKEPASPSGWGLGNWRLGLAVSGVFALIAIALSAFGSTRPEFQAAYPMCHAARHSAGGLLSFDLSLALYFIAWESFFRGYLTLGLEKTFGVWAAFVQMLPFVVVHFDKPFLEALSSVFGGVIVGLLALRTRSFWYGALIHIVLAVGMDLLVTARVGWR
jgi:membrane protease YdiL (CAAX protease family)